MSVLPRGRREGRGGEGEGEGGRGGGRGRGGGEGESAFSILFLYSTDPITRTSSKPNYLSKVHLQMPSHLESELQ